MLKKQDEIAWKLVDRFLSRKFPRAEEITENFFKIKKCLSFTLAIMQDNTFVKIKIKAATENGNM
jgi:hypothetical protein